MSNNIQLEEDRAVMTANVMKIVLPQLFICFLLHLCTSVGHSNTNQFNAMENSLRKWAHYRDLHLGTAVAVKPLREDAAYRKLIARECSIITPENAMKFGLIHPGKEEYFWDDADSIVDFAKANAVQVYGHTLVWHQQLPKWLTEGTWQKEELKSILRDHIFTVVKRYRGQVIAWDVVNEAIDDKGNRRETFWSHNLGPDYIEWAFRWAHEADPNAKLMYNDYNGEGLGVKSDSIFELVKDLKKKNVPIHGIGLQTHWALDEVPGPSDISLNMARLGSLGLDLRITEMDVRIKVPITAEKLEKQAVVYRQMLELLLQQPNRKSFVMWGITDRYSWIPKFFKETDSGLIFDTTYNPKPAYHAIHEALSANK